MKTQKNRRLKRSVVITLTAIVAASILSAEYYQSSHQPIPTLPTDRSSVLAVKILSQLKIRAATSKSGYSRKKYSDGWVKIDTCTIRDKILARDMTAVRYRSSADCTVTYGILNDPYTGKVIHFIRGPSTSAAVQIDHVVAVSDSWQTGAQQLSKAQREQLYNDPLELLAVDGPANEEKGDGDAAAWIPSNTDYDCRYVARQIAVKQKYHLWVTPPEHAAMEKVLKTCPGQMLPSTKS